MIKGYGKLFWTTGYHQNDNGKDSEIINWAKKGKKEVGGRGGGGINLNLYYGEREDTKK